jgi:uncharacterized membrane-anchored protein
VTRPLGASFADWFGKPVAGTGVGLGDGLVAAAGLVGFLLLVCGGTVSGRDHPAARRERHGTRAGQLADAGQVVPAEG